MGRCRLDGAQCRHDTGEVLPPPRRQGLTSRKEFFIIGYIKSLKQLVTSTNTRDKPATHYNVTSELPEGHD